MPTHAPGGQLKARLKRTSASQRAVGAIGGVAAGLAVLYGVVELLLEGHFDYVFVAMEAVHIFGILILLKKVAQEKNVEGLSLQSQQLTAAYLGLRLVSSAAFEGNHHTFLDAVTLACTLGVVAMMRGSLRRTYDPKLDMDASAALKYVLAPCVVLGLLVNPGVVERVPDFLRPFAALLNVMWASSVFLEAVSVVPQLVMIKNVSSKLGYLERNSTAHYVFSLGIARFLGCASWILQPNTLAFVFSQLGSFKLWGVASLLSELIQTFVLADFCYYYIRSMAEGSGLVRFHNTI